MKPKKFRTSFLAVKKLPESYEASMITEAWLKNGTKGWDEVAEEVKRVILISDKVSSAVKQYYQKARNENDNHKSVSKSHLF